MCHLKTNFYYKKVTLILKLKTKKYLAAMLESVTFERYKPLHCATALMSKLRKAHLVSRGAISTDKASINT
jgi:hypothetical protein